MLLGFFNQNELPSISNSFLHAARSSKLPEHDLFRLLSVEHGPEAYRHYRSLLRRLSLENALECQTALEPSVQNPKSKI